LATLNRDDPDDVISRPRKQQPAFSTLPAKTKAKRSASAEEPTSRSRERPRIIDHSDSSPHSDEQNSDKRFSVAKRETYVAKNSRSPRREKKGKHLWFILEKGAVHII
jgi:hypothetical protein